MGLQIIFEAAPVIWRDMRVPTANLVNASQGLIRSFRAESLRTAEIPLDIQLVGLAPPGRLAHLVQFPVRAACGAD